VSSFPLIIKLGPKPLNWAGQCDPFHQLQWQCLTWTMVLPCSKFDLNLLVHLAMNFFHADYVNRHTADSVTVLGALREPKYSHLECFHFQLKFTIVLPVTYQVIKLNCKILNSCRWYTFHQHQLRFLWVPLTKMWCTW
jgi:hypothetical protein